MRAISRRNDEPKRASRPFDVDRDGFVVAEGAAMLMLEDLGARHGARARAYTPKSWATVTLRTPSTSPRPWKPGKVQPLPSAWRWPTQGCRRAQIDYINAHGTSTPLNDRSETCALKYALGECAYTVPVSSTKSVTGHLMGAAGSVEAVFSIKAIQEDFIPPTINLDNQDPDCDLDYTPNCGRPQPIERVMSNSFGFGGHNAVLIFSAYHPNGSAR